MQPRWVSARVPWSPPPPSELLVAFDEFVQTFRSVSPWLEHPANLYSGVLTSNALKSIDPIRTEIRAGAYSDPVGVDMYLSAGTDADGLELFRSMRGSNRNESFHSILRGRFLHSSYSLWYLESAIGDTCYRWNVRVRLREV